MKKLTLVLLILMATTVMYAKSDRVKTLTIRWEQPSLTDATPSAKCEVTETELKSALSTIKSSLKDPNLELHYGFYAATTPNTDKNAIGRLWIDNVPLETWLASTGKDNGGSGQNVVASTAAECGAVSSDQVVKAALDAADRLMKADNTSVSASESNTNSSKR